MEFRNERWVVRKPAVTSRRGVVTSQHWRAASIGAETLARGGNAVDAAISTALSLEILEPWMSGLGGVGYMVVYSAAERRTYVVDFSGVIPRSASLDDYPLHPDGGLTFLQLPRIANDLNIRGYRAPLVPGTAAGLGTASERFGRLPWQELVAPAIALAERGLPVDWHAALTIGIASPELILDDGARALFLPQNFPPQPGTHLPLTALSRTLSRLSDAGWREFYTGSLADSILTDLQAGGSRLLPEDFSAYEALVDDPVTCEFGRATLHGAADTSSAPRVFSSLERIERLEITEHPGPEAYVAIAEALENAHLRHWEGTPDIGSTTHLSSADAEGNLVALTFTQLSRFGSKVVLPNSGILLNNGMAWLDPRPNRPNTIAPGKRARNNMCPLVLTRDDRPWMALGAAGAHRIVSSLVQTIAFLVKGGMSFEEAFHHPRIHATGRVPLVADIALGEEILRALARKFDMQPAQRRVYPRDFGAPSGVQIQEDGTIIGMGDVSYPMADAVPVERSSSDLDFATSSMDATIAAEVA